MTNIVNFRDVDQIEVEACDWLARLDSGAISDAEAIQLKDWLREDARHARILMEVAEVMDKMTVLSYLAPLFPLGDQVLAQPGDKGSNWFSGLFSPAYVVAACLAMVAVVLWNYQAIEPLAPPKLTAVVATNSYTSHIGEIRTISLTDGSRVTLNSNSRLDVNFTDVERRFLLVRGEAKFDVAHDTNRPFRVLADGNLVTAVGTSFNVEIARDAVEVTVTDGIIEVAKVFETTPGVDDLNRLVAELQKDSSLSPPKRVVAGETVVIDKGHGPVVTQIKTNQIEIKLSWQRGELIFTDESLEYVIAEVSRYTATSIIIIDDEISDIQVGGRFPTGDVDNLLDVLEHGFGIQVTRVGENLVHLARANSPE